jgi:hypothetical protein
MEMISGTWNVRTIFNTAAMRCLLSLSKEYRLADNGITGNKMAGQTHNGYEISHILFAVSKKREQENLGWHL